jgi:hypothetical protein
MIPAEEAPSCGFVVEVVQSEGVDEVVKAMCCRLVACTDHNAGRQRIDPTTERIVCASSSVRRHVIC